MRRSVFLLLFAASCAHAPARLHHWQRASSPESVGFSSTGLRVVAAYLKNTAEGWPKRSPTALMVIAHGKVLLETGDTSRVSYIASVRKSVLAVMVGKYVKSGQITPDETLASLGLDDVGGLSAQEREATVADLLTARSGVFHAAANPGDSADDAPPRGSQKHGTYFLYNNWDFNALGTIFEKRTGRTIYDALETELARPLGMEDFRRERQVKDGDDSLSLHPAYHMYLSTRDMARLGQLMLRQGVWGTQRIIDAGWVRRITTVATPLEQLNPTRLRTRRLGYGMLWWVFDDAESRAGGPLHGAYTAMGAVGQFITVIPALDVVIAEKTVPGDEREVGTFDYLRFVDLLVAARRY